MTIATTVQEFSWFGVQGVPLKRLKCEGCVSRVKALASSVSFAVSISGATVVKGKGFRHTLDTFETHPKDARQGARLCIQTILLDIRTPAFLLG